MTDYNRASFPRFMRHLLVSMYGFVKTPRAPRCFMFLFRWEVSTPFPTFECVSVNGASGRTLDPVILWSSFSAAKVSVLATGRSASFGKIDQYIEYRSSGNVNNSVLCKVMGYPFFFYAGGSSLRGAGRWANLRRSVYFVLRSVEGPCPRAKRNFP